MWSNSCPISVAVVVVANMSFTIFQKIVFSKSEQLLTDKDIVFMVRSNTRDSDGSEPEPVTTVYCYMNERKLSLGQNRPSILGTRKIYHRENGPYKKVD